ncbi:MAG: HDIG domain-containing protein [Proteobacteria bacterium]|nr:HDIG domain-containing protein [Pseudomonadota bacterium]
MAHYVPTRDDAFSLLKEFNTSESLINHALAVEATMKYLARKQGEDETMWGIIGLIHDLDYEKFPGDHCSKTEELLRERNWPSDYIRAVVSHGWGICSHVEPLTVLEKTLYAIDELTGLVNACALVRPSKSVMDLTPKSVRKKWNQKGFAAGANRSVIEKGALMLGVDINDLVQDVIMGMREVAGEIGLG